MILRYVASILFLLSCTLSWGANFNSVQDVLSYSKDRATEMFGYSIAMSGNYAVIGAPGYNNDRGRAYLYEFSGGAWNPVAVLSPSDPLNGAGEFGKSVAMQGDTIIVSAPRSSSSYYSKLYLFAKPAAGWVDTTESAQIALPSRKTDAVGISMSWVGDDLVTGVLTTRTKSMDGMAYVLHRTADTFSVVDSIFPPVPTAFANFGKAVAVENDVMVIGEPGYNKPGRAYLYERSGGVWALTDTLLASEESNYSDFGASIAISNGVIAVASPYLPSNTHGGVFVFENSGSAWVETAKLTFKGNNHNGGLMGNSGLAFEGNHIVVGVPGYYYTYPETKVGTTVLFKKPAGGWANDTTGVELSSITQIQDDEFGFSVAAANGRVLSSSIYSRVQGTQSGLIRSYNKPSGGWVDKTENQSFASMIPHKLGFNVKVQDNVAIASAIDYDGGKGAINVYEHNGVNWVFKAHLTASNGMAGDEFAYDIAIDGNVIVASAAKADVNGLQDAGAVYLFEKSGASWVSSTETCVITEPSPKPFWLFGSSVDVHENKIAVGVANGIGQTGYSGYTNVVTKTGSGWCSGTQTTVYSHSDKIYDYMGKSVAIGDSVLFVGSDMCNAGATDNGCVDVFQLTDTGWVAVNRLAGDAPFNGQKFGFDLDYDQGTLVVGAFKDKVAGVATGAVYVFENTTPGDFSTMTKTALLSADSAIANDQLGVSVGISQDLIVAGANGDDSKGNSSGAAYVYQKPAGGWQDTIQSQKLIPSASDATTSAGRAVAIDKTFLLLGGPGHDLLSNDMGAIFAYRTDFPAIQAKNITATSITYDSIQVTWTPGNGDSILVAMQLGTSGNPLLVNGVHYNANAVFGQGDSLGNGWYVVYKGVSQVDTLMISGLTYNKNYRVRAFEFSGEPNMVAYNQSTATANPLTVKTAGERLDLVKVDVAQDFLRLTTVNLEYNTGAGWLPCSADTTFNVNFQEGSVWVRNAGHVGGEHLVKTLVKGNAPVYFVDFANGQTQEVIPTSVEFNTDSNFTTANTTGNGTKLLLNPGENIYLRIKATTNALPSHVFTLVVPALPVTPQFSIDYMNEMTAEIVSSAYQYSDSADMSGAIRGAGNQVGLNPGTDLYFQQLATDSSFASAIQHLVIASRLLPGAINWVLDFVNEQTDTSAVAVDYYYSKDTSGIQHVVNEPLPLLPADTLNYRLSATDSSFASSWSYLTLPARPLFRNYGVNYTDETLDRILSTADEVSTDNFANDVFQGDSNRYVVTPGTTLYLRKQATDSSFHSKSQVLALSTRPVVGSYTIDYANEVTEQAIASGVVYESIDSSVVGVGQDSVLALQPGRDMKFRIAVTDSSFASNWDTLVVPTRPALPQFTINYSMVQTTEVISSLYQYSTSADMSSPIAGVNDRIDLTPGTDLYFQKSSTNTSFASAIQHLSVPNQPVTPLFAVLDFVHEQTADTARALTDYYYVGDSVGVQQVVDIPLPLIPGGSLYHRLSSTDSSFASAWSWIILPERPTAPQNLQLDTLSFTLGWDYLTEFLTAGSYECSSNAGLSFSSCINNPWSFPEGTYAVADLQIRVAAGSDHFNGVVAYNSTTIGDAPVLNDLVNPDNVFINPSIHSVENGYLLTGVRGIRKIEVFDLRGSLIYRHYLNEDKEDYFLPTKFNRPGNYLVRFTSNKSVQTLPWMVR